MATEQEMMADLAAADKSGDTALATHIAGLIKAQRAPAKAPVMGLTDFQSTGGGAALGNPTLKAKNPKPESDIPYELGGLTSESLGKTGLPPWVSASLGTAVNFGARVGDAAVGGLFGAGAGKAAGAAVQPLMESGARTLMQSALKPLATMDAVKKERAITTMLENNARVNQTGISELLTKESTLAAKEKELVSQSDAVINLPDALKPIEDLRSKFMRQSLPNSDVGTIDAAKKEFLSHPLLQNLNKTELDLERRIADKNASMISAMQDAGRFRTFEAQQGNLAKGGDVNLSSLQPVNEPYINVGATGGRALSPSAYPVSGEVRAPARYTENAQRVPEGSSAYQTALKVAEQRKAERDFLQRQLDAYRKTEGAGVPVQLAQELKQGTYARLGDKAYSGELKSAEAESGKALARGWREQIEKVVPEVAPINKERSDLINAIKVATRREAIEGNKNPMGLSMLAHSPQVALLMMADRSATVRSALANYMHAAAQKNIPLKLGELGGGITGAAAGASLADLQR